MKNLSASSYQNNILALHQKSRKSVANVRVDESKVFPVSRLILPTFAFPVVTRFSLSLFISCLNKTQRARVCARETSTYKLLLALRCIQLEKKVFDGVCEYFPLFRNSCFLQIMTRKSWKRRDLLDETKKGNKKIPPRQTSWRNVDGEKSRKKNHPRRWHLECQELISLQLCCFVALLRAST